MDTILYLFTSKLNNDTQSRWKERIDDKPSPSVEELFQFLHSRANALEPMNSTYHTQPRPTTRAYSARVNSQDNERKITPNQTYLIQPPSVCNLCNGSHTPRNCRTFLSMSVPERTNLVRENNLCSNCLRETHTLDEYTSGNCMVCRRNHHTLLHADRENSRQPNQTNLACLSSKLCQNVILSTAVINIRDQT